MATYSHPILKVAHTHCGCSMHACLLVFHALELNCTLVIIIIMLYSGVETSVVIEEKAINISAR